MLQAFRTTLTIAKPGQQVGSESTTAMGFQASSPITRLGYTRNRSPFAELLTTVNRFLGATEKTTFHPKSSILEIKKISWSVQDQDVSLTWIKFHFLQLEAMGGIPYLVSFNKPFREPRGFGVCGAAQHFRVCRNPRKQRWPEKGNLASERWNKSKASSILTRKMEKVNSLHKMPIHI